MLRKILFATDFSALSRKTLTYVAELARKVHAKVLCTHSVTLPGPVYSHFQEAETRFEKLEQEMKARLEDFCRHPGLEGIEIESRLSLGLPEQTVNRLATVEKVDLLVLGKNSRSPVERFFLGSATEKIVREASCPVLVVPDIGSRTLNWNPVVCCVDFSNNSIEALNLAARLTTDYHRELEIVHIVEVDPEHVLRDPEFKRYVAVVRKESKTRLRELVKMAGAPAKSQVLVDQGKASDKIVELARQLHSDLVILGVRGIHMHRGRGTGSTANALMREASCPVLLMPC